MNKQTSLVGLGVLCWLLLAGAPVSAAEAAPGFERHFHGLIDEVMLFEAALCEEAVERLYRSNR